MIDLSSRRLVSRYRKVIEQILANHMAGWPGQSADIMRRP